LEQLRTNPGTSNDSLEATTEQPGVKLILDELRQIVENDNPNVIL
jgi:hypothetical protein